MADKKKAAVDASKAATDVSGADDTGFPETPEVKELREAGRGWSRRSGT